MKPSELKQPFADYGVETWIDENNRLMMSIPEPRTDKFTVGICNSLGELIGHLVFEKQIRVKTQTIFAAEEWLSPNVQTQDPPDWLQSALGLYCLDS